MAKQVLWTVMITWELLNQSCFSDNLLFLRILTLSHLLLTMCFFKHSDTSEFKMDLFSKERNVFFFNRHSALSSGIYADKPAICSKHSELFYFLFIVLVSEMLPKYRPFNIHNWEVMCMMDIYSEDFWLVHTVLWTISRKKVYMYLYLLAPSKPQSMGPKILLVLQWSASCISSKKVLLMPL